MDLDVWAQFGGEAAHVLGHSGNIFSGNIEVQNKRGGYEVMSRSSNVRLVILKIELLLQMLPPAAFCKFASTTNKYVTVHLFIELKRFTGFHAFVYNFTDRLNHRPGIIALEDISAHIDARCTFLNSAVCHR